MPHFASEAYLRTYNATIALAIAERLLAPTAVIDVTPYLPVDEPGGGSVDRQNVESLYAALFRSVEIAGGLDDTRHPLTMTWREFANERAKAYVDSASAFNVDDWLEVIEGVLGVDPDSTILRYVRFTQGDIRHPSPLKSISAKVPQASPVALQPSQQQQPPSSQDQ